MIRRPPRSTRTDTLFAYSTLFRSVVFYLRGGGLLLKLPQEDEEPEKYDVNGVISAAVEIASLRIRLPRPPVAPTGHWKRTNVSDLMGVMARAARLSSMIEPLSHFLTSSMFLPRRQSDPFSWKDRKRVGKGQ